MTNLIRRNHDDRTFATSRMQSPTWDPFRMMDALLGWEPVRDGTWVAREALFSPSFDVKETKDAYLIQADLPGLNESDVDVTVTGRALTISGKRHAEHDERDHRYYAMERSYGTFSRTFSLPDGANLDDVSATLKHGVLTLHVPKRLEVQPRKISVGKEGSEGTRDRA
jgi:HSP20 family protein